MRSVLIASIVGAFAFSPVIPSAVALDENGIGSKRANDSFEFNEDCYVVSSSLFYIEISSDESSGPESSDFQKWNAVSRFYEDRLSKYEYASEEAKAMSEKARKRSLGMVTLHSMTADETEKEALTAQLLARSKECLSRYQSEGQEVVSHE